MRSSKRYSGVGWRAGTVVCMGVSLMVIAGCGAETASPAPTCADDEMACGEICVPIVIPDAVSLHNQVVFRGCAGSNSCHTGSNPKEQLDLTTVDDMLAMVGKPSVQRPEINLVEPGQPELSYLINKLRGAGMSVKSSSGNSSKIMPRLAPAMCDEVIEVVEEWILDGAK